MKVKETKVELYKQLIELEYEHEDFFLQLGNGAYINDEFHEWLEKNAFHYFMSMRRTEVERERPLLATMTREERRILINSIDEANYND